MCDRPRHYSIHYLNFLLSTLGAECFVGHKGLWLCFPESGSMPLWKLVTPHSGHTWSGDLISIHLNGNPSDHQHTRRAIPEPLNMYMDRGILFLLLDNEIDDHSITKKKLQIQAAKVAITGSVSPHLRKYFSEDYRLLLRQSLLLNWRC